MTPTKLKQNSVLWVIITLVLFLTGWSFLESNNDEKYVAELNEISAAGPLPDSQYEGWMVATYETEFAYFKFYNEGLGEP